MRRRADHDALARRFGSRLTQLCQARGWAQREVSRRSGIPPNRLSRLGRGLSLPKFEELLALRAVFATGLEELVFGESAEAQEVLDLARRLLEIASREEEASLRSLLRKLLAGVQHVVPGASRGRAE
jgi:transcriptional regulator with XRE-family HTH domain